MKLKGFKKSMRRYLKEGLFTRNFDYTLLMNLYSLNSGAQVSKADVVQILRRIIPILGEMNRKRTESAVS